MGKYLDEITKLDTDLRLFFNKAISHVNLSTRGCRKILKVARTIADMEFSKSIQKHHISEALQYRLLDIN